MGTVNLDWLGRLESVESSCVVPDDPGEVVRGARPLDDVARAAMREQATSRLRRDDTAIVAREQHMAERAGKLTRFRKRA